MPCIHQDSLSPPSCCRLLPHCPALSCSPMGELQEALPANNRCCSQGRQFLVIPSTVRQTINLHDLFLEYNLISIEYEQTAGKDAVFHISKVSKLRSQKNHNVPFYKVLMSESQSHDFQVLKISVTCVWHCLCTNRYRLALNSCFCWLFCALWAFEHSSSSAE